MIYITGDTHGDMNRIVRFCERMETSQEDIMIILGDVGLNYNGDSRDRRNKEKVANLPITLFCIHGNHERRPTTIVEYKLQEWNGGKVWVEEAYPNILFAKDGEIYDIAGMKTIVIGGAYSVDKFYRLSKGFLNSCIVENLQETACGGSFLNTKLWKVFGFSTVIFM